MRLHGASPEIEVYIAKKGSGVVTAADIEAPADLEILNPELEIAHVSDKGKLEMTLTIGAAAATSRRAQPRPGDDDRRHPDRLDLLARAPRRVRGRGGPRRPAHGLRQARPRRHDRRLLDPRDAIAQAAEILIRQLAIFTDLDAIEGFGEAAAEAAEAPVMHGMENFPIEELELGVRSYNCLKRVGIETIGDLTSKSENELVAIPNFGRKSIEEVRASLGAHGLTLKGEELVGG